MNSHEQTIRRAGLTAQSLGGPIDRLARGLVLRALALIEQGQLTLIEGRQRQHFGAADAGPAATLQVRAPVFYRKVAFGGSLGAAEAYLAGLWDCDDLPALMRLMVRNLEAQQRLEGGATGLAALLQRLLHRLRDNHRSGSRRNIAAHYDLGNDFYQLFLDPTLAYSCGLFASAESTMAEASTAKFDLICRKLRLAPGMRLLEIGTGWGGFALHAARHYGCQVTTTTISRRQHEYAAAQIAAAGLGGRITLLDRDYRDLEGEYDRLVSIEMIEAVGHRHLPTFFAVCAARLKADGLGLIQAITLPDQAYLRYLKSPEFINRYIFPGGCCPSLAALAAAATPTDLRLVHLEDLTPHYVTTLQHWRRAFLQRLDEVRALGYGERFLRMWDYYLCYCEGGFAERYTGLVQLLYARPHYRGPLPAARSAAE